MSENDADSEWHRVGAAVIDDHGSYGPTNMNCTNCEDGFMEMRQFNPTATCSYCGTEHELAVRQKEDDDS